MFTIEPYGPVDAPRRDEELAAWFAGQAFDEWWGAFLRHRRLTFRVPQLYSPCVRIFRTRDCRPWITPGDGTWIECKSVFWPKRTHQVRIDVELHQLESWLALPATQGWIRDARAYTGTVQLPGITGKMKNFGMGVAF